MNKVVLIGRLTRDPELRYIPNSERAVAKFTLAVDKNLSKEKRAEFEAQNRPTADFIPVTVWGKQAESVAKYLQKGLLTAVEGRIETGSYLNDQNQKIYTTDVVANSVEFIEWPKGGNNSTSEGKTNFDGFAPVDPDTDDIPF